MLKYIIKHKDNGIFKWVATHQTAAIVIIVVFGLVMVIGMFLFMITRLM